MAVHEGGIVVMATGGGSSQQLLLGCLPTGYLAGMSSSLFQVGWEKGGREGGTMRAPGLDLGLGNQPRHLISHLSSPFGSRGGMPPRLSAREPPRVGGRRRAPGPTYSGSEAVCGEVTLKRPRGVCVLPKCVLAGRPTGSNRPQQAPNWAGLEGSCGGVRPAIGAPSPLQACPVAAPPGADA